MQKNLQAAKEAEILAKQEIEIKQQDADRMVGLRQAKVQEEVGIANEQQKQKVQEQAQVTAERQMEVKRVQEVQSAEIEKQAAEVKASQDREVTKVNAEAQVIQAEANKKVQVTNAEATKEQTILHATAEKEKVELNAQATKTQIELKADADLKAATNEAKGTEAKGKAVAVSRDLLEKAQVAGQIELFDKVNKDKEYQEFLVKQRQVEAMEKIGVEQAKNLSGADIKIFANAGSVADGVTQAGKVLNPKTGLDLGSMLESLSSVPAGKELLDAGMDLLKKKKGEDK